MAKFNQTTHRPRALYLLGVFFFCSENFLYPKNATQKQVRPKNLLEPAPYRAV